MYKFWTATNLLRIASALLIVPLAGCSGMYNTLDSWTQKPFDNKDFSVVVPPGFEKGTIETIEKKEKTGIVRITSLTAQQGDNILKIIKRSYPERTDNKSHTQAETEPYFSNIIKQTKGEVVGQRSFLYQGEPAREFTVKLADKAFMREVVVAAPQGEFVAFLVAKSAEELHSNESNQLFNSLKFKFTPASQNAKASD